MKSKVTIFWFRRDLRLEDNIGLYHALSSDFPVVPIFIFDTAILSQLENSYDRRVDYIHQALTTINIELESYGSKLNTYFGKPLKVFEKLSQEYDIQAIFCNRDGEPQALKRDFEIFNFFKSKEISFRAYKDQVVFNENDILKKDGTPYIVFTPYFKKWKEQLVTKDYESIALNKNRFFKQKHSTIHSLNEIGFKETDMRFKKPKLDASIIDEYDKYRDYPALQRTTGLGIALRFGTISIRKCVAFALKHNETWLSKLVWREFFMQILFHYPKVVDHSFRRKYDFIEGRNNEDEFQLWCEGKTGYPIVDAGMRELNQTGFMHNRVRMIVASFLCKDLLIDWRWGEAYFAQKLNDYELASNNGNWQWAAGSGCDAAPYFRIFNPTTQSKKFDKEMKYIRKWIPEIDTLDYPKPIVEHSFARKRALDVYGRVLKKE